MTVQALRRAMTTAEKAAWIAYDRYRGGRQQQAALKAKLREQVGRNRGRAGR